jgi:4a-hydroxytetrahydrobiopterin dehydratase
MGSSSASQCAAIVQIPHVRVKHREILCARFLEGRELMWKIQLEKQNHHPDIDIRWNTVTLVLSTHSAGGLTENDFKLAKEIDDV